MPDIAFFFQKNMAHPRDCENLDQHGVFCPERGVVPCCREGCGLLFRQMFFSRAAFFRDCSRFFLIFHSVIFSLRVVFELFGRGIVFVRDCSSVFGRVFFEREIVLGSFFKKICFLSCF